MPISETRSFRAGDIVVVPFPYSDRNAEKRRPALVVSNEKLAGLGYFWIAMITTSRRNTLSGDVLLTADHETGLPQPSIARTAKIACIEPDRIIRRLGVVDNQIRRAVLNRIAEFLAE